MGQRNRSHGNRPKGRKGGGHAASIRPLAVAPERKIPVEYGKPFILLEDAQKVTFIYQGFQWIRHSKSIAECRQDGKVKELPQKINGMTRYEICMPLAPAP